ncbi:MAG: hypothetical protein OXG27_11880 [Chloroflexi bacterium]|nr:hypothetical protein [Chloroflexota bacterium]
MGKFADAIRDRRKGGQRRLGFGAASEERQPTMLVGTIGVVDGADFCLALNDDDRAAAASSDVAVWGTRLDALTVDHVGAAKESGAAFVSFDLDGARADAMLDDDVDYVVRLGDLRIDEADARALGSLRPAELAVEVEFPVGLGTILELRRLALLTSAPIGVKCPTDISAGDIEALRDSGVAVFVLDRDVSSDDIAAVKQRIADLPERKPKRGEDAQPLIPTMRPGGDESVGDD